MEERNYTVYKHTFPNNKIYIGITQQQPEKRWKKGLGYDSHQKIMKRAIKKYGWDNIKHEILFQNLSKDEACKKEIDLIAFYDSTNKEKGYNISQGGEGTIGVKPSEASKQKNRIAHLGKKASLETRKKISESNKGHCVNEETKRKIGNANRGRVKNEETIQKWKESHKGYIHSENTKRKLSENNGKKRKVLCVDTGKIYNSIIEASRDVGISACCISQVCNEKIKTAAGYRWMYVDYEGGKK